MGLGCVAAHGSQLRCIGHRLVRVKPARDDSWAYRLRTIYQAVTEAITDWDVGTAAVENVFVSKNASSALKLGQARGAAMAAIAMADIPLAEYTPRSVKQALTASGGAGKEQVETMVRLLLGSSLEQAGPMAKADVSDALAVAICHANTLRTGTAPRGGTRGRIREKTL